jgi:acetone carboxylase, alpha subunit
LKRAIVGKSPTGAKEYPMLEATTQRQDEARRASAGRAETLRHKIRERQRLTAETGHYWGLRELSLKEADPMKYERFYSRLQSACMAAREVARFVAASPGGREMGEAVWALATAEGDSIALSEGFVAHAASFPVAIEFMVEHGYEENPGFEDGDVYVGNDGYTCGAPHPGDVYTYVPIVRDGEVVAWSCAINHIMEVGAPQAGSFAMFCVDSFMDGFLLPPTKTGENLKQYAWWDESWKRRTRAGTMNILDDKMRLAGAGMILRSVHEIIDEFGVEYFKQASREVVEESRRVVLDNIRSWMVPGTYEQAGFRLCAYRGMQKIWEHADKDNLMHVHLKTSIDQQGRLANDTEGSSRWGFHAFNAFPGGFKVALMLGCAGALSHNTKFAAGGNYAVTCNLPEGSIYNPGTPLAAHSVSWGQMIYIPTMIFNSVNRAQFMRGYMEESFVVSCPWDSVQGEGTLADGTHYGYTNFEFIGTSAHGAFAYRDGEPAVWFIASQLCNMGNSEEFEQLVPPLFHLGRKLQPGYCGHGKYRGGIGLTAVQWIVEPGQRFSASHAGGACSIMPESAQGCMGGYPTPGGAVVVAQGTNLPELIESGNTPTTFQETIDLAASGQLKAKKLGIWKMDAREHALAHDDLWSQMAGSGGGWGDPLERDPAAVVDDAETNQVPAGFSKGIYGVVLTRDDGGYVLDEAATQAERAALRAERRAKSVPVRDWWRQAREGVLAQSMIEPVRDMYRSSTSFENYDRYYRDFWQLPDDFEIGAATSSEAEA